MFLHQSEYLEYNLYRAGCPGYIYQVFELEHCDDKRVKTYIRVVKFRLGKVEHPHCHRVVWVAVWEEVASGLVSTVCVSWSEVYVFLCPSGVAAVSWESHFGSEAGHSCGFDDAYSCVHSTQGSPFYAQKTQFRASSFLRLSPKKS